MGRHDRRTQQVTGRVGFADLEEMPATETRARGTVVGCPGTKVDQLDIFRRGIDDIGPAGVGDQLGDHPADRDVLVMVHRGARLVVVVVMDVIDGVVVDVPARLDEEADERGSIAQVAPVARLVFQDRDARRDDDASDDVGEPPPIRPRSIVERRPPAALYLAGEAGHHHDPDLFQSARLLGVDGAPPVGPIHRRSLAAHRLTAGDDDPRGGRGGRCGSGRKGAAWRHGPSTPVSGRTRPPTRTARRSTPRRPSPSTRPPRRRRPSTAPWPGSPAPTSTRARAIRRTGPSRRRSPRSRVPRTPWCRLRGWLPWRPPCSRTWPRAITWSRGRSCSPSPTSFWTRTSRAAVSASAGSTRRTSLPSRGRSRRTRGRSSSSARRSGTASPGPRRAGGDRPPP